MACTFNCNQGRSCECEGPDGEDSLFYQEGATRSLFASPMFWFCGVLAVALWTGLYFIVLHR